MPNFFIVASFHDYKAKKLVGYRVYNHSNGSFEDVVYGDLVKRMALGFELNNARLSAGDIVGTNGSLGRLTKINFTTGKIGDSTPLIMVNKVGKNRYTLVDFKGVSRILPKRLVIEMNNKYGIANCKIREVNKEYVISSIFGGIPQVPDNTETEGRKIDSCHGYYINQIKNMSIPDEIKELNTYICIGMDTMERTREEVMNIIDNSLDRDMSKDVLINYMPVGTVYLQSNKYGTRIASSNNSGIGAELNGPDFSSVNNIPFDSIRSIRLTKLGKNFELNIKGMVVIPNKRAVYIDTSIELDGRYYTIVNINTNVTEGVYSGKQGVKKSKYNKLAKLLGFEVKSEKYIKDLKSMTPEVWVNQLEWSPELDTIAESIGFDLRSDKSYYYVLSDDLFDYTSMLISEVPDKDYNDLSLSRKFKAIILDFDEKDCGTVALIKLKVGNDIISEVFSKVSLLDMISKAKLQKEAS